MNVTKRKMHDKIWGVIALSSISYDVCNHPVFKRLSQYRQLGILPYYETYKHATHTRFDHSRGVAYLARFTAINLQKKHRWITDEEVCDVELAGLLHDVGHGPFSHQFDDVLGETQYAHPNRSHECRGQILAGHILTSLGLEASRVRRVQFFIDPCSYVKNLHEIDFTYYPGMDQIVNNNLNKIDVDKFDYLTRDGFYLLANFDLKNQVLQILDCLECCMIVDGVLTFHIEHQILINDLIMRRYTFHKNVYVSEQIGAITCMIKDVMRDLILHSGYDFHSVCELNTQGKIDLFATLTDDFIIEYCINSTSDKLAEAKRLTESILQGTNLYEYISSSASISTNENDPSKFKMLKCIDPRDANSPTTLLSMIKYHSSGVIVANPQGAMYRIYKK